VLKISPTLTTPNIGAATGASLSVTGQLTSTVSTGTPPFVVSSTTLVPNLHAATADSATNVTGVIPYANGGTNNSAAYTQGSVVFAGASSLTQDNPLLFWDDLGN